MKIRMILLMMLACLAGLQAASCSRELSLKEVVPAGGIMSGGETVAIVGSGFKAGQGVIVYFGSRRAPHAYIEGNSKVVVTTPAYEESTLVDVRVVTDEGKERILTKAFMYVKPGKWSPLDGFGKKPK
jgi:hypothetical protein